MSAADDELGEPGVGVGGQLPGGLVDAPPGDQGRPQPCPRPALVIEREQQPAEPPEGLPRRGGLALGQQPRDARPEQVVAVVQGEQQHLVGGREVVLHRAHRDARLGGHGAQARRLRALGRHQAHHRLGDRRAPLLVVHLPGHPHSVRHALALHRVRCNASALQSSGGAAWRAGSRVNGEVQIAYEVFGKPEGRPLLLISGLDGQMIGWPDGFCDGPLRGRVPGGAVRQPGLWPVHALHRQETGLRGHRHA